MNKINRFRSNLVKNVVRAPIKKRDGLGTKSKGWQF